MGMSRDNYANFLPVTWAMLSTAFPIIDAPSTLMFPWNERHIHQDVAWTIGCRQGQQEAIAKSYAIHPDLNFRRPGTARSSIVLGWVFFLVLLSLGPGRSLVRVGFFAGISVPPMESAESIWAVDRFL